MAVTWHVATDSLSPALAGSLASMESCMALPGKRLVRDPKSSVVLLEQDGVSLYIKKYFRSGKFLRKFFGRSRLRAEWENLQYFQALGIPTPTMVAWGEERRGLRFIRGALVTLGVPYATNLLDLHHTRSPLVYTRQGFEQLAGQIAEYTRRLHESGFAHSDLNWRNILVSCDVEAGAPPEIYFFDCPAGRRWWGPFLEHRIVKDLALLEKIARQQLPLRWRLWFYHQYTGRQRLTAKDKQRLRRIAAYFD